MWLPLIFGPGSPNQGPGSDQELLTFSPLLEALDPGSDQELLTFNALLEAFDPPGDLCCTPPDRALPYPFDSWADTPSTSGGFASATGDSMLACSLDHLHGSESQSDGIIVDQVAACNTALGSDGAAPMPPPTSDLPCDKNPVTLGSLTALTSSSLCTVRCRWPRPGAWAARCARPLVGRRAASGSPS